MSACACSSSASKDVGSGMRRILWRPGRVECSTSGAPVTSEKCGDSDLDPAGGFLVSWRGGRKLTTMEGPDMSLASYPTEAKPQCWRAVAVYDDRPEILL